MSAVAAPKEKTSKFWKKLGLGKQKSSGDGTPSRPASILSRASSTDKLSEAAANIRIEPSESTRRNKRLSLISGYNHRRTISETTGNISRSQSTMNMTVPEDAGHHQQFSRSTSQTLKVTGTMPERLRPETVKQQHPTPSNIHSEDEDPIVRTTGTMQINSLLSPEQSVSDPHILNSKIDIVSPNIPSKPSTAVDDLTVPASLHLVDTSLELLGPVPQPSSSSTLSVMSEPKSSRSAESYPGPTSSIPTRSNLSKLSSLRGSSSAIPRTTSGSSLRQQQQQQSRLRQPSTSIKSISSFDALQQSPHISKLESLTIATMPANTNVDELETSSKLQAQAVKEIYYSLDEDQSDTTREAELLSDLERERDVIRVLQGQKIAIGKDLEFLNHMVEDLETENEQLKKQCESQKQQNEHSIQDMDLLLEKVKSANAIARDAEREKESLRRELEVQSLEVETQQSHYEGRIAAKDKEIHHLTAQLEQSKGQIKVLKSTMEQLLRVNVVNKKEDEFVAVTQTPDRLTPATSPEIQSAKVSNTPALYHRHSVTSTESEDRYTSPRLATYDHQEMSDTSRNVSPSNKRGSTISNLSKRDSILLYDDNDDLDDQMRSLIKQKERLQSDYSKIPIIGGGPQSRKRMEDLEEQLDAIDSQLSKVKLRIRSRV